MKGRPLTSVVASSQVRALLRAAPGITGPVTDWAVWAPWRLRRALDRVVRCSSAPSMRIWAVRGSQDVAPLARLLLRGRGTDVGSRCGGRMTERVPDPGWGNVSMFDAIADVAPHRDVPARPVKIAGRVLDPTAVFDTYWRFAAARQSIYMARMNQAPAPWTEDEVLLAHRFTNVFRAADRVSQYLIGEVQRGAGASSELVDVVFRTLLFKIFNREDTWAHLESRVGGVAWRTYDYDRYRAALDEAASRGPIYSAAYVMPPPRLGEDRKHANHLRLLEQMMRGGLAGTVRSATSLRSVYETLASFPGLGPFLAFQYTIDLNYSDLLQFDEDDFVVAGPGAKDGIRKCFGRAAVGIEGEVIGYMVESQDEHFARLGLTFPGLFGRRLHLIDAQNLFCEVDKYARVRHPDIAGISGRSRIKQKFTPGGPLDLPVFPLRWGLDHVGASPAVAPAQGGVPQRCLVEVHDHPAAAVVAEGPPGRVARQDRPLPLCAG